MQFEMEHEITNLGHQRLKNIFQAYFQGIALKNRIFFCHVLHYGFNPLYLHHLTEKGLFHFQYGRFV